MPLHLPPTAAAAATPFYFQNVTSSLDGSPPTTNPINFTAGASNADGAAVTVLSALSHDVHRLRVLLGGIAVSGVAAHALADVLVDPAGGTSWTPLINDLVCGFTATPAGAAGFGATYDFPIYIASGSSIGIRARTAHSADVTTGRALITAWGNPSVPAMWWYGTGVETLGVTAASSKGTDIIPGNGSLGSWANVGGATTQRYGAIALGTNGTDASMTPVAYCYEIGTGSAKLAGTPTFLENGSTAEASGRNAGFDTAIFCDIASGTQLQVRALCSSTPETPNVALYGVY